MASQHHSSHSTPPAAPDYQPEHDREKAFEKGHGPLEPPPGVSERKLLAKIDMRLLPAICLLYLLAFLDRVNIANANVFGMSKELKLTGTKYNTALVIFFVPYVLFEIPSNILLKRLKPHLWLSLCMVVFGTVTICQGLVHNYSGLLTTRFFLGLAETGIFPGCFYLLAMYYKRAEAQKRYSFFFSSTTLAGAFGGLIASGIGEIDGARGYLAWRWVFIIEGAITVVCASILFFVIPDFPEEAKFLSDAEREFVKQRLADDVGKAARFEKITPKVVANIFKDYKMILGGLMYFALIVPAYGYAYFSPAIVQSLGYGKISTQLHSVPPWAVAFGLAMTIAYLSDFTAHRYLFTIFPICVSLTGFIILYLVHHNVKLQYAALFLCAAGTYSAMPVIVCWFNTNLAGHHQRAVGTAWQVGFGNIGGIIATFAFLSKEAPKYPTGYKLCIGFVAMSAVMCTLYFIGITWENRKRDKGLSKYENLSEEELDEMNLGNQHPKFRFLR